KGTKEPKGINNLGPSGGPAREAAAASLILSGSLVSFRPGAFPGAVAVREARCEANRPDLGGVGRRPCLRAGI
ncbi:hypothetical protein THAOC_20606, partial [Thalassiosira oceanica]